MLSVLAVLLVCGFASSIVFVVSLMSGADGGSSGGAVGSPDSTVGSVHVARPLGAIDPAKRAPALARRPTLLPKAHKPIRRGGEK